MKNKIATIIVFFISISCFSQSITPAVNNIAGGVSQKGYYVFEWSVGEMSLTNQMNSSGNLLVTNGFLQPYVLNPWTYNPNSQFDADEIKVFPIPASTHVEIDFFTKQQGLLKISFYDAVGQKVYYEESHIYGVDVIKKIPLNNLSAGSYVLRVDLDADPNFLPRHGIYKVIKAE